MTTNLFHQGTSIASFICRPLSEALKMMGQALEGITLLHKGWASSLSTNFRANKRPKLRETTIDEDALFNTLLA